MNETVKEEARGEKVKRKGAKLGETVGIYNFRLPVIDREKP